MHDEQLLRYSRHILLPQIGIKGQETLLQSHVLIVGAGGLGSPVAMYLAASGIGRLAAAVNMGDASAVHALLTTATTDVIWEPSATPSHLVDLAIDGRSHAQGDSSDANACGHRHYLEQLQRQRPTDDAGNDAHDAWALDTLRAFVAR